MIRTMSKLWSVNPGFDPQQVLTFGVAGSTAVHGAPDAVRNGLAQTLSRFRSVPGVAGVSVLFGGLAMSGDDSELPLLGRRAAETGRAEPDGSGALLWRRSRVSERDAHSRCCAGASYRRRTTKKSPCAVAIDEDFAARAFPRQDPLGQHINLELLTMKCEVVGIVGHVKHWGLDADASAKVAFADVSGLPASSRTASWIWPRRVPAYVVRAHGDPYVLVPALKQAVGESEREHGDVRRAEHAGRDQRLRCPRRRFTRLLLGTFAALALVLAAVGIYGVVSYSVTQSTHDIGVRMALGADKRAVLGSVLKGAMSMAGLGIALGAAAASRRDTRHEGIAVRRQRNRSADVWRGGVHRSPP